MPDETAEEAVMRRYLEGMERRKCKHLRTGGNEGAVFLKERKQDPVIDALNQALKSERLRNVN
ncbi:MAG: hypothetical protein WBD10_13995 [Acidobacteriaceae bacterium]